MQHLVDAVVRVRSRARQCQAGWVAPDTQRGALRPSAHNKASSSMLGARAHLPQGQHTTEDKKMAESLRCAEDLPTPEAKSHKLQSRGRWACTRCQVARHEVPQTMHPVREHPAGGKHIREKQHLRQRQLRPQQHRERNNDRLRHVSAEARHGADTQLREPSPVGPGGLPSGTNGSNAAADQGTVGREQNDTAREQAQQHGRDSHGEGSPDGSRCEQDGILLKEAGTQEEGNAPRSRA